jgi:site-specific DNA-methyltransferase (adenine-specific)
MKPYYQDEAVTIYHGDCREIVPGLGRFDLLLTDPPYGMNYSSAWRTKHQRLGSIQGDDTFPLYVFDWAGDVASFIFCRWDNLSSLPKPKSFIAWDKECHSMGDLEHEFGRQWEACAFYPGERHSFLKRPVDIIRVPRVAPARLLHPTEKPVELLARLIECHPTGSILDPFAGSGTTGRAAKDLGRKAVLIEREEKYCEIAARRMAQEVLSL